MRTRVKLRTLTTEEITEIRRSYLWKVKPETQFSILDGFSTSSPIA